MDTCSTRHLTPNLNNVITPLLFSGSNNIGNGTSLEISHVGSSSLLSGSRLLILKNVLHVPRIAINLLSVHKLPTNNKVVIEFHANGFIVKDQTMKKTLVQGKIDSGLYKLCAIKSVEQNVSANCANIDAGLVAATLVLCFTSQLNSNKASFWHNLLGHPATEVMNKILSICSLPQEQFFGVWCILSNGQKPMFTIPSVNF